MEKEEKDLHKLYQKSKGEVYTPLWLINKMFKTIQGYYPNFFMRDNLTFYDGCCGTGNAHIVLKDFLKEGRLHLYSSEDDFEKDVIMNTLFGNDIQNRNVILSVRGVDPKGLVPNNENFTCENFEKLIGFFKTDNFNFGFLNPPFGISNVEAKMSARPFTRYGLFLKEMTRICRKVVFIHPLKAFANRASTPFTNKYAREILTSKHIREMWCFDNITTSNSIFEGVNISGGVVVYFYDKDYVGETKIISYYNNYEFEEVMMKDCSEYSKYPTFIYSKTASSIIDKVISSKDFKPLSSIVSTTKPFGLRGCYNDYSSIPTEEKNIYFHTKKSKIAYVSRDEITKNIDAVDHWKCFVAKTNSGSGNKFPRRFYSENKDVSVLVGSPNSCCSESFFLVDGTGKYLYDKVTCKNFVDYCYTKFHSFIAYWSTLTQDTWTNSYCHIPLLDFSKRWTDEDLYEKYHLTQDEIDFIENFIV